MAAVLSKKFNRAALGFWQLQNDLIICFFECSLKEFSDFHNPSNAIIPKEAEIIFDYGIDQNTHS